MPLSDKAKLIFTREHMLIGNASGLIALAASCLQAIEDGEVSLNFWDAKGEREVGIDLDCFEDSSEEEWQKEISEYTTLWPEEAQDAKVSER